MSSVELQQQPDFDDDDQPDWNMDPKESFSDWTIQTMVDKKKHAQYHVHRVMLAVRCRHFKKVMLKTGESASTSIFHLNQQEADSFPILLDHVYNFESRHGDLTRENVLPLSKLASELGIPKLLNEICEFWKRDLTWETLPEYYSKSLGYANAALTAAMVDLAADNFFRVDAKSEILKVTQPDFWEGVLNKLFDSKTASNEDEKKKRVSVHWCTLIVAFFKYYHFERGNNVDQATLHALTSEKFLPEIENPSTAWTLAGLELNVVGVRENELSSLQRRCIECIAKGFDSFDFEGMLAGKAESPIPGILRRQSKEFLTCLYLCTCACKAEHALNNRPLSMAGAEGGAGRMSPDEDGGKKKKKQPSSSLAASSK